MESPMEMIVVTNAFPALIFASANQVAALASGLLTKMNWHHRVVLSSHGRFTLSSSLVPRPDKGRRKGPGFHCLRMHLIIRNRNAYS